MIGKNRLLGDKLVIAFAYGFVGLFALVCLYPLVLTLSVSFSSEQAVARNGYSILPMSPTWDTYKYIFVNSGMKILKSYGVTIFITVAGTTGALLITSLIAFSLSVKKLKYRNVLAFISNFTIIFSAGLIPWYMVSVNYYGLKDSILALILPSIFSVWNMFLMRTYFASISTSLYEAAEMDGANYFTIYMRIALPLSKTALLTVGLMYALQYWNDWWHALIFIQDQDLFPLQYYLYNILSNVNAVSSGRIPSGASGSITLPAETVKMAVTVITIGPIIFLYPFVQKYFVHGIMAGAVKE
ncbi:MULTISPECIES: carbohydrate ABC transporter permease [Paenibacillus]|uniref:Binding-protein-dependent transport systems inner membrane component n=2 Tax=Paenibacillus lactis TaxID=228574 RepID=G4H8I3_9BACL|nr:carbohydrate ABC transporter permease [Paenibacillus lactis]EHB68168.1 binding-protein-dependent transport systems inner membrane component [Paenibacillus lactis 154]MBP1892085.1 putative aldouronate transport system permease protein [Paenibacillus lactis]MCM3492771.1 carbohydrate ABC transporter permease [Paenibacillus lactis]GIO89534.1 sugar ABC transporter permease [Paenibacillus lactis]HAF99021.1 carbohydrate ABC transporter permease [Paenibacillus lactis]